MNFLSLLFDTSDFNRRWYCGHWTLGHGLLHILSDLGVWSAYVAIPCVLIFFLLKRRDLPFKKIFVLFGAFILACGTTHLMEAVIFWWPAYRLAGVIKCFTAVISWTTVVALAPVIPKVLAFRSPEELEHEIAVRTKELQEADRKKTEFLAILAHELRNPLAPIANAVQIMRLTGDRTEDLVPLREMMERQVRQLSHLVEDLMDVSRITRAKIVLRKERLELSEVVNHAIEVTRGLFEGNHQTLTLHCSSEPLPVDGDKTRLTQVLTNLLTNAAKYTPEGGSVWVTLSREGDNGVIRVRDNGMGIPRDMMPFIFDMFTQVNRQLGRSQGGLGIGLTLVRSLLALHDGTIEAHSDGPDQGSEFTIRLPLLKAANAKPVDAETPPSEAAAATPSRVLVVDDNQDSANSLASLVGLMGHDVRIAFDGAGALAVAKEFRPEIVLLDIGLPGLNGYDVARRLRELTEVQNALIIAQTGWGQEEDKLRSAEAGFDAHLVKPVNSEKLVRVFSELRRKTTQRN